MIDINRPNNACSDAERTIDDRASPYGKVKPSIDVPSLLPTRLDRSGQLFQDRG